MPYQPPRFQATPEAPRFQAGYGTQREYVSSPGEVHLNKPRLRRRRTIRVMRMGVAYLYSVMLHGLVPIGLIALNLILYLVLGLELSDFLKPPAVQKPKDLVFVIAPPNQPEKPPLNPNTLFRADRAMQAAGEHDPDRAVNLDEPNASQMATQPAQPPQPRKWELKKQPQKQAKPFLPKKIVSKPAVVVSAPLPEPMSASVPLPAIQYTPPTPLAAASGSRPSLGSSLINPGPGNKSGAPSVDALKEPDFGNYMKDLQRRIKESWQPPRGNESKRVVVVFQVNKNGTLHAVKVTQSSGVALADQAAIAAVEKVFPFRSLPSEYQQENIDIEFTFDYNVFGDKNRKKKKNLDLYAQG